MNFDSMADGFSTEPEDETQMEVDERSKSGAAKTFPDEPLEGDIDLSDIPSCLVATNVADAVFEDLTTKKWFESLLQHFEEDCSFHYFRNFHRIRINFQSPEGAVAAKIALHQRNIAGNEVGFYFAEPYKVIGNGNSLEPPEQERQFLLSPPASPPVGWEPIQESEPVINYDLLAAITKLQPGETHELHRAEGDKPSIVVHTCEDAVPVAGEKLKIIQTRRPGLPCE